VGPKSLLLMALFMPIYSKSVYFLTSEQFCVCTKVVVTKLLAPLKKESPKYLLTLDFRNDSLHVQNTTEIL
jgi:hypothetical protein